MKHFKSISELCKATGSSLPENPLLYIHSFHEPIHEAPNLQEFTTDFFWISLKNISSGLFMYGRTQYDHENGSMYFMRPRQVIEFKNVEVSQGGFFILFHEDFIKGHSLFLEMKKYGFFDYETNEALHLSPSEEKLIKSIYRKIEQEYFNNTDEFSKEIILSHIEAMLKYAQRYYKRQFINRKPVAGRIISKLNEILNEQFSRDLTKQNGLPTVEYLASQLHLSPRYLSDLLKQETGKTALEHIHIFLIDEAKNLLRSTNHTIAETAYDLGFENPPYFSRLFKKETGMTPKEFREQLN